MRFFVIILILFSVTGVVFSNETIEEIESIEIIKEAGEVDSGFLGLDKHQWLSISGPIIWSLLVLAIGTRWIKIKGQARLLLKLHKIFAYSAFCIATLHGIFGLFF